MSNQGQQGGAHIIRSIGIHVNIGQHCCSPFADVKSPAGFLQNKKHSAHAHSSQRTPGFGDFKMGEVPRFKGEHSHTATPNNEHAHSNQSVQGSGQGHIRVQKCHRAHRSMTSGDVQPNQPGHPTRFDLNDSDPWLEEFSTGGISCIKRLAHHTCCIEHHTSRHLCFDGHCAVEGAKRATLQM